MLDKIMATPISVILSTRKLIWGKVVDNPREAYMTTFNDDPIKLHRFFEKFELLKHVTEVGSVNGMIFDPKLWKCHKMLMATTFNRKAQANSTRHKG